MGQAIAAAARAPEATQGMCSANCKGVLNLPGTISDGARDAANQIFMEVAMSRVPDKMPSMSWAQAVTEGNLAPKGTGKGSSSGTYLS